MAAFLSHTVPDRLTEVRDPALSALPVFHINLQMPASGADAVALELARCIREDFAARYA